MSKIKVECQLRHSNRSNEKKLHSVCHAEMFLSFLQLHAVFIKLVTITSTFMSYYLRKSFWTLTPANEKKLGHSHYSQFT